MKHIDSQLHVRGTSEYVDDQRPPEGMLYAAVFGSPIAHGNITALRLEKAKAAEGVRTVLTIDDIPGSPVLGPIIPDELLLARDHVAFRGEPIVLVVAETRVQAEKAVALVEVDIDPLPVVTCPREAHAAADFFGKPSTYQIGDVDAQWDFCAHVIEGSCDIGGQEHVPLETNRARALPRENGQMTVWSSTQSPYAGQKAVASLLGIAEHLVEIDVKRLGGGFGGKEDQATHWACMAALGAHATGCPVEIVLRRHEDVSHTGKRHPYLCDFKLGLDAEGNLLAYEAWLYQNAGAFADLSLPVLERSLLHATNAYDIPNVRVMAASCKTNLPPNTAFRGFGGPQAMFVIESALAEASDQIGIPRDELQKRNLIETGDQLYYGQVLERCQMQKTWDEAEDTYDLDEIKRSIAAYNDSNFSTKKAVSVMPVCFGISFTKTFLNQGSALVHVYTDGSVAVTTGGIEMGQGVSTNMAAIAARSFGIHPDRIKVEATNTTRIANMSPSAASATSDINGNAVLLACQEIRESIFAALQPEMDGELGCEGGRITLNGNPSKISWEEAVAKTYLSRRRLSAHGFYATPGIEFDNEKGWGTPFAYHVYGTCITEVTVDCLRGTYKVDAAKIVHDIGRPINPIVDVGQVEGGLVQGLGWMTMEDLVWNDEGRILSGALSTYKLPDIYFCPDDLQVNFLEPEDNPPGPLGSKAVGEPPLMYGIGVFFAIRDAMKAFNPKATIPYTSPMTPERVLMGIHQHLPAPHENLS